MDITFLCGVIASDTSSNYLLCTKENKSGLFTFNWEHLDRGSNDILVIRFPKNDLIECMKNGEWSEM